MTFKVVHIIDGDTIEVMPPWKWGDRSGIRVRPSGYNIPEAGQSGYQNAMDKLRKLLLKKK